MLKKTTKIIMLVCLVNILFPVISVLSISSMPSLDTRDACSGEYEIVKISSGNPPASSNRCLSFDSDTYDVVAHVACADTYLEAKAIMNSISSDTESVASIIYNGDIIDSKYAVLNLRTKGSSAHNTNILNNNGSTVAAINGFYGSDAPLLDYNPNNNRVKLKISGLTGWISKRDGNNLLQYEIIPISILRSPTYYYVRYNEQTGYNELMHKLGINVLMYNCNMNSAGINLGPAPNFLELDTKYYSFDGNYFYTDIREMIDDYKADNFTNAVNNDDPYYNYYQYLSYRTKTSYTAADINHYLTSVRGFTAKPEPGTSTSNLPGHLSMMYNEGPSFIEAQDTFGANAMLTFGLAVNESGWGRSNFAINRNNLFGHGAYDYAPGENASSYASIKDSINYHSDYWVSSWYLHPDDWRYFGSHFGNKASGMNVKYATDPYWGEKMAQHYYIFDRTMGMNDYQSYDIGIKNTISPTASLNVRKEPHTSSSILYQMKNNNMGVADMPVVILDTIIGESIGGNNVWYKIQSDVKMDENRNKLPRPSYRAHYDYDNNYAYVHSTYIRKLQTNQINLIVDSKTIIQGSVFDPKENVFAYDNVEGDLTDNIQIIKNDVDTTLVGEYEVIYRVSNSVGTTVTKTIIVTVRSNTPPVVNASDKEILQHVPFNLLKGVTAIDAEDGDITNQISVTSDVNIFQVGTYTATYTVTDSDNNTVERTINITVVLNSNPVINAVDKEISKGQEIDLLENVTAFDGEDGDLTHLINVIGSVDVNIPGVYFITYTVTDSDGNKTLKSINITVKGEYQAVQGSFYLHTMDWNSNDTLNISGHLTIKGIHNLLNQNIRYEFLLKNTNTQKVYSLPLERWNNSGAYPFVVPSENGFNYTDSWFKGNLDLSDIPEGNYEAYIKARMNGRETTAILRNSFSRNIARKVADSSGRGYLFRTNYYLRTIPLEIFIRDQGLISSVSPPTMFDNMFNSYQRLNLIQNNDQIMLDLKGYSFNIMGEYGIDKNIIRNIVFEEVSTYERFTKTLGYVDNANIGNQRITLRLSDGKDKTRAWFDNKVNITDLPIGHYVIYIRTKSDTVDDYGELTDISFRKLNQIINANNKNYSLSLNEKERARIELIVSAE